MKQAINNFNFKTDKLITVNLRARINNRRQAIELNKVTTDPDLIKIILLSAFHDKPLIIYPTFINKILSLNTLIKYGILYKEENNYFFTI